MGARLLGRDDPSTGPLIGAYPTTTIWQLEAHPLTPRKSVRECGTIVSDFEARVSAT